jgi:hypothetical protein
MLIASIINLSFAAFAYLAATIYSLLPDKSGYEVKTYAGKGVYAIGHVGAWIGFACLIPSVIVSANPDADLIGLFFTGLLSLMVLGGFFALLSSAILFSAKHEFEAIKGDTIYIRRFIKIKEHKVSNLSDCIASPILITLVFNDGRRAHISSFTKGLDLFMAAIEQRREGAIPFETKASESPKAKSMKTNMFIAAGCALFVGGISSIGCFTEPVKEESLVTVQGEVDYIRKISGGGYAIGIHDNLTEYRVSNMSRREMDGVLIDEVKAGDILTMGVENNVGEISNKYGGRLYQDYVCTISAETKTYLTYEGYVKGFVRNRNTALALFIGGLSVSAACFVIGGVMVAKDKRKSIKRVLP